MLAGTGRRLSTVVVIVATVVLVVSGTAEGSTPTPAEYLANLNSLCRSYTPKLDALGAEMARAQKAGDAYRWGVDLGALLKLGLAQDAAM